MNVPSHMTVVDENGFTAAWSLSCEQREGDFELALDQPGGTRWVGNGEDVASALDELRDKLEPLGYRLCCNGCRMDAGMSGMLRDSGGGRNVYLLDGVPRGERPPIVSTLDYAAPELVTTREAQSAWYEQWLARPVSRPPLPSTLTMEQAYAAACHTILHYRLRNPDPSGGLEKLWQFLWSQHDHVEGVELWRTGVFQALGD